MKTVRYTALLLLSTAQGFCQAPFYLERETFELKGNVLTLFNRGIIARRSDGTISKTSISTTSAEPPIRKVTRMDGSSWWLIDNLQVRTTWSKMTNDEAIALAKHLSSYSPVDCEIRGSRLVGTDPIAGEPVVIGSDAMDTDRQMKYWLAPGLACEMVHFEQILSRPDGSKIVISEARPVRVTHGEPDARLFDQGEGYTELPPSELRVRQLGVIGKVPWQEELERNADWDRQYRSRNR